MSRSQQRSVNVLSHAHQWQGRPFRADAADLVLLRVGGVQCTHVTVKWAPIRLKQLAPVKIIQDSARRKQLLHRHREKRLSTRTPNSLARTVVASPTQSFKHAHRQVEVDLTYDDNGPLVRESN